MIKSLRYIITRAKVWKEKELLGPKGRFLTNCPRWTIYLFITFQKPMVLIPLATTRASHPVPLAQTAGKGVHRFRRSIHLSPPSCICIQFLFFLIIIARYHFRRPIRKGVSYHSISKLTSKLAYMYST